MKLHCLLDNCPKTSKMVDWRKCSHCQLNPLKEKQPETGCVECSHPQAISNPKPERWQAMKQSVGTLHLTLVGGKK